MLKVVSHTPIEVEHLAEVQAAGKWVDVTRQDIADGLLYSCGPTEPRIGMQRTKVAALITSGRRPIFPTLRIQAVSCVIRGWSSPAITPQFLPVLTFDFLN